MPLNNALQHCISVLCVANSFSVSTKKHLGLGININLMIIADKCVSMNKYKLSLKNLNNFIQSVLVLLKHKIPFKDISCGTKQTERESW